MTREQVKIQHAELYLGFAGPVDMNMTERTTDRELKERRNMLVVEAWEQGIYLLQVDEYLSAMRDLAVTQRLQ